MQCIKIYSAVKNETRKCVYETLCPQLVPHFQDVNVRKMSVFKLQNSDKNNLRSISQPHAYFQSMVTMSVNFQKYQYKTVGGVAHARYPLSIHLNARKND